ncbi:MAG: DUF3168 domain-containing protein [Anaerolineae bacterium]|jgi:hypothetical protein|nr:DUF3168 domain-containing protein [Anaerolineae bacterium]
MIEPLSKAFRGEVVAAVSTLVGGRVYNDTAPTGANMPYVIVGIQSARSLNLMQIDEVAVTFNVMVTVDSAVSGDKLASEIAEAIYNHMQDAEPAIDGWDFHRLEHVSSYRRIDVHDKQRFALAGGLYKLEADRL